MLTVLVDHLLKTEIEYKDSKKEEIHDIFYQSKLDKACFQHGMAYKDFKYLLEEQFLIKYSVIKHLILLKMQNMMNIKKI